MIARFALIAGTAVAPAMTDAPFPPDSLDDVDVVQAMMVGPTFLDVVNDEVCATVSEVTQQIASTGTDAETARIAAENMFLGGLLRGEAVPEAFGPTYRFHVYTPAAVDKLVQMLETC